MYVANTSYRISIADYLEGEKETDVRYEYVDGFVYAIPGSTPTHNIIAGNIQTAFNIALQNNPCVVYASDMKVKIENVFYYPDVMVVCDNDMSSYFQEKPCVIVEVLSDSTARKDLHEKRFVYQGIEGLKLYLLVNSRFRQVLAYYRTDEGWQERSFTTGETIPIPCVNTELNFMQLYAKTELAL